MGNELPAESGPSTRAFGAATIIIIISELRLSLICWMILGFLKNIRLERRRGSGALMQSGLAKAFDGKCRVVIGGKLRVKII